jgi:hypothetical protein
VVVGMWRGNQMKILLLDLGSGVLEQIFLARNTR